METSDLLFIVFNSDWCLFFHLNLSLKILVQAVLPITTGAYWFVTAYVVMILLAPYLNLALHQLSKKDFQKLLLVLVVLGILNSIFQTPSIGFRLDESTTLMALYPFGYYIRKYKDDFIRINSKKLYVWSLLCLLGMYLSALVLNFAHNIYPSVLKSPVAFSRMFGSTSPFQILLAMSIFSLFLKKPIKHNRAVNKVSSYVFGVYLLHCHPLLIDWIWLQTVHAERYSNSYFVFVYAIVIVVVIYLIGIAYDFIRQIIFDAFSRMYIKIKN